MTFDEYMKRVEYGIYPDDPKVVLDEPFRNANGSILNLGFGAFGGTALIGSAAGSVRSNHYHKTDWHFLYVLRGSVHYYYRPADVKDTDGKKPEPSVMIFREGEMFFTPPMMEHAVYSPSATEMISVSKNARRHVDHEADLVRVELLSVEDGRLVTHR